MVTEVGSINYGQRCSEQPLTGCIPYEQEFIKGAFEWGMFTGWVCLCTTSNPQSA